MSGKRKSIFINEEDFLEEEIIEVEVSELDIDDVIYEFPKDKKPGTEEMIRNILGDELPVLHKHLPDLELEEIDADKALERPTDLSYLVNCPRCNTPLQSAIAITGAESPSFNECSSCGTLVNTFKPIRYQAELAVRDELYVMSAGGFGCHAPDELILLHNGQPKKARDVVIGDQLMGPDGTPRTVLTLHHGYDTQYQVTPRGVASPMLFNGQHLMYLYNREYTGIKKRGHHNYLGQYAVMTIEEYEKQSKRFKQSHYWLFAEGFEYPEQPVTIEPYLLGLLLGDGYLGRALVTLTTCDEVIIEHVKRYNKMYELKMNTTKKSGTTAVSISFTSANRKRKGAVTNILTQHLKDLDLIGKLSQTKHIPDIYKYNSKDVRMKLLAGLIDSDGYQHCNTVDITLAAEQLAKDIKEVALSLGIRANIKKRKVKGYEYDTYYRVTLSGKPLSFIPVLLERKKVNSTPNKNQYRQRVDVVKTSDYAEYYGFEVDKDNLYVEANNYSIVHNSGKSRGTIEKVIQHLILIPNARVVVSARTYPAIEATFVKDFFSIMPKRLLRRKNEMKHEWVFTNGSELMLRSFDDPTKLRGINATMWVLLEASNIQKAGFELAQNRIRNTAALLPQLDAKGNPMFKYDEKSKSMRPIYAHDARRIIIETNPDSGWVKKDFLQDSGEVVYYGSAYREGYRMNTVTDPKKFTMVMATDANPYLPEGFIEEQTRGKSPAYIQQFFYGSFNFSEGLVYPNVGARIVKPHPLPREFDEQGKRVLWYLIGLDYGISDPLAIIYAALSTETKKLYFFDEVYESGLDIKTAVSRHREKMKLHKITNDKLMMLPLFDGRSHNKREANLQTIGALFRAEGLYFTPSFTYNDARIAKFNGIINEGEIEIFSNLDFYIEEVTNYKFKMNRDGTTSDKPMDKNNHAINAGEFIIMALPLNISNFNMSAYVPTGTIHIHDAYEGQREVKSNTYNPYEGGNNNDNNRNSVTTINNRYRRPVRTRYNRLGNPIEEQEENTNQFEAYIPNRSKR